MSISGPDNTRTSKPKRGPSFALVLVCLGILVGSLLAGTFYYQQNRELIAEVRSLSSKRVTDASLVVSDRPVVIADAQQLSDVFRSTAESVKSAVVYIQVAVGPSSGGGFFHDRLSVGSGVIVSANGYIVTNYHVVENAARIDVTLADKREFQAELVGYDSSTDLAVIKVRSDTLPFVPFSNSDDLSVGEWVLAVGNPFRLTSTVTAGIVSALSRDVDIIQGNTTPIEDFIQTDAAINPGNSGGALVDLAGNLIGINTAIATESGSSEGYGFAVPSNLVRRVVADIIEYGEVRRGYLGVSIQEMTANDARAVGLPTVQGVLVREVCAGCSAEKSGLKPGDVILSINERPVNATNQLQSVVASNRPGENLRMSVWREQGPLDVTVKLLGRDDPSTDGWLAEQTAPPQDRRASEPESFHPLPEVVPIEPWGFGARELTTRDKREFGTASGVLVAYVERESVSAMAGLPRGSVIESVDGVSIYSTNELKEALSGEGSSTFVLRVVKRDGVPYYYELDASMAN